MKQYSDKFLQSLYQAYLQNPDNLDFKKYFALELYKKNELEDAYQLLKEIFETDKDINVEKAVRDIETKISPDASRIGFKTSEEIKISKIASQKKKDETTFADVAGMDEVKEAIRTDIIYPFQHPEIYQQYNKKAGGGILLFGPPGCGKTFIAKATAGEINANFFSVSIHEMLSAFTGEGERFLHDKFEMARAYAPSVLFFDEIDAIGMSRAKTLGTLRTLVNQFLIELDGIATENKNVLIIGATNLPWEVDPALRRPGRFSRVLFVSPPDKKARARIFELNIKNRPREEIDFEKLAGLTKQYSSADITRVCDEAAEETFKKAVKSDQVEKITQELLEERIKNIKSSITDWFNTVNNYIQYSNESGLFNSVKDYLETSRNE